MREGYEKSTDREGSLSVFYAGIFTCVISALLGLLTFGRYMIMQTGVRKDLDISALGVMSGYSEEWADQYGLFMIPAPSIEKGMEFFLKANASHGLDTYHYDDITVTVTKTLKDPQVLTGEIVDFMKIRGLISILDEILDMLKDIEDSPQLKSAEGISEAAESLKDLQELYALLVEDVDGARSDGYLEDYAINKLFKEDPLLYDIDEILWKVLDEAEILEEERRSDPSREGMQTFMTISSEELGTLERALSYLQALVPILKDASYLADEIADQLEEMKQDPDKNALLGVITFTPEEMRDNARIFRKNGELVKDAVDAMEDIINMMLDPVSYAETVRIINKFSKIREYDYSVHLTYEFRPASAINLSRIFAYVMGFPEEISELAPDVPLGIGDKEDEEKTEWDIEELTLGERLMENFLVSEYCLRIFRNFRETISVLEGGTTENIRGDEKKNRVLNNEVEFLIVGKDSEYANVNGVRNRILWIRTLFNMAFLVTDQEKYAEAEAIAASTGGIILPGVGDAIALALVLTIWSRAEAIEDYRSLTQGDTIPLWKSDESWKVSLESVLSMDIEAQEVSADGLSYEQYLRLLLYTVPEEVRLRRIQTLLSINHGGIDLENAVVGFNVEGEADGIMHMTFSGSYVYE